MSKLPTARRDHASGTLSLRASAGNPGPEIDQALSEAKAHGIGDAGFGIGVDRPGDDQNVVAGLGAGRGDAGVRATIRSCHSGDHVLRGHAGLFLILTKGMSLHARGIPIPGLRRFCVRGHVRPFAQRRTYGFLPLQQQSLAMSPRTEESLPHNSMQFPTFDRLPIPAAVVAVLRCVHGGRSRRTCDGLLGVARFVTGFA